MTKTLLYLFNFAIITILASGCLKTDIEVKTSRNEVALPGEEFRYEVSTESYRAGTQAADNNPEVPPIPSATFTIEPELPAGLYLDVARGSIKGTPLAPSPLTEYKITVSYRAGKATAVVAIEVKDTPATLEITSPNSGANLSTSTASQTLSGNCSTNATNLTATVGGVSKTFSDRDCSVDGTWSLNPVTLGSGANVIVIAAKNASGESVSDTITITYDAAPSIAITGGDSLTTTTASPLTISGTCSSNAINLSATVEGVTKTFSDSTCSDGNWVLNDLTLNIGTHEVIISAQNSIGSSVSDTMSITVNDIAATIAITGPSSSASWGTSTQSQTISGTCSTNATHLTTSVGTFSDDDCSDEIWSLNAMNMNIGDNEIEVTAENATSQSVSDSITITYDSAPSIAITGPVGSSFSTNTFSQTITGTCSTDVASVTTTLPSATVSDSVCSDGTWALSPYDFDQGTTTVTVTATKASGVSASSTITVTYCDDVALTAITVAPSFAGGSGTVGDPYWVANAEQLKKVKDFRTSYFKQTADIDLTCKSWTPIGGNGTEFAGNYNGNGHSIKNLYMNAAAADTSLFGRVGVSTFTNITLSGIGIKNIGLYTGGLFGRATGVVTASNISVSGLIQVTSGDYVGLLGGCSEESASNLSNINVSGNITASASNLVGGIAGLAKGIVSNSHSRARVVGLDNVGGLFGKKDAGFDTLSELITDSAATGQVLGRSRVGGLVGDLRTVVTSSYATGKVTATGSSVGGLVGIGVGVPASSYCYATGDVTSTGQYVGGLVGGEASGVAINFSKSYATGNVSGSNYVGGFVGNLEGTVSDSYATGNVTGTVHNAAGFAGQINGATINRVYASGTVPTNGNFGQFSGWTASAIINNSYALSGTNFFFAGTNSVTVDGVPDTGTSGIAGGSEKKSAANLKAAATFSTWNFDTVWTINEGVSYPTLRGMP